MQHRRPRIAGRAMDEGQQVYELETGDIDAGGRERRDLVAGTKDGVHRDRGATAVADSG